MAADADPKDTLKQRLDSVRNALIGKVEGLPEREARMPRTPTGTNLIGIVKHCLNVEAIYLGDTFDRPFPQADELISLDRYEADPQIDWYATEDETVVGIIGLYRRVIAHANATIDALDLDAVGHVKHWGGTPVTLHEIATYTYGDIAQHAGQADILREGIDGAVGWLSRDDNVPQSVDFPAYVAKLTELAERF
ncbi:DinB family protein [Nocardioides sp. NPDC127503]|uniref:DinB family protein n=1 Tax=Nocardioides sp. NPDC127503 TaxID=3154516 RepID=UPI003321819F